MASYSFRTAEATVPVAERAAAMCDDAIHLFGIHPSAEIIERCKYMLRGHLVDHENAVRRACTADY
jgi:hypothetical protein